MQTDSNEVFEDSQDTNSMDDEIIYKNKPKLDDSKLSESQDTHIIGNKRK